MNSFVLIFEDENRYATSEDFKKGIPDGYKEYQMPSWRSKSRASQAGPVALITDVDIQRCFIESNRERVSHMKIRRKTDSKVQVMDVNKNDSKKITTASSHSRNRVLLEGKEYFVDRIIGLKNWSAKDSKYLVRWTRPRAIDLCIK